MRAPGRPPLAHTVVGASWCGTAAVSGLLRRAERSGMPASAIRAGANDGVLRLDGIAALLVALSDGGAARRGSG